MHQCVIMTKDPRREAGFVLKTGIYSGVVLKARSTKSVSRTVTPGVLEQELPLPPVLAPGDFSPWYSLCGWSALQSATVFIRLSPLCVLPRHTLRKT